MHVSQLLAVGLLSGVTRFAWDEGYVLSGSHWIALALAQHWIALVPAGPTSSPLPIVVFGPSTWWTAVHFLPAPRDKIEPGREEEVTLELDLQRGGALRAQLLPID